MNLNRRTFLKSSSILVGGIILQGNKTISSLIPIESNNLRQIRNNIGIYNEKGGTIGWYVQDDTVVVIDSQFPDSAKNFKSELSSKTSQRINYLINTHHHGDHTLGNYFLKDYTENIVAHVNCPRLQIKQNKGKETESQVVTANITFDNMLQLKLPKENLSAIHFGQAHTGGDIVVHFENANIVHLGDLVFNNVYPFIDNSGECSVLNWIEVLVKIEKYFDNDTSFIFGHANNNDSTIGKKDDIIVMRNYLEALSSYVSKLVEDGKTVEEISNTNTIPGFDNIKEAWEGARKMNLKATAEQFTI
jgi:cyclase